MDDIKAPDRHNKPATNPAAPETSMHADMGDSETPEMHTVAPAPVPAPESEKKGMKGWLVALLVVLALVVGGAGVYFWQTSKNTSSETEALQSQIDSLNQDLADAQKAAADNTLEAKDKEIDTLTAENKVLTDSNAALQKQVDAWQKACGTDPANPTCTTPETP